MDKYLPYSHSFNEELLAKELFTLSLPKVRSIVNYNIRNNSFVSIFSLVARYLLHIEKLPAVKVRELLRKYAVIISYLYLKSVKEVDFTQFESIALENAITNMSVKELSQEINGDSLFIDLYNDISFNKNLNKLCKKIKKISNGKVMDAIYRLLRGEYNYFSKSTNVNYFIEYPDMKRFDMIVSEALVHKDFYSFTFSLDFDMFKQNFTEKVSNDQIRMAIIFVGYLVYDLFNKENFKFKKDINYISNKYFVLATLDKTASIKNMKLNFLKQEKKEIFIDWSEFKKFNFSFNNISGTFNYKKIDYSIL